MQNSKPMYDVAIVGGGPVGSTVSSLLKRYAPDLRILVVEKEKFPRDHVGESQLPGVSEVLNEMGCWEKVEAAGFPIKIGLSLTWGNSPEPWDFDFFPSERFVDEPRPAAYEGQRRATAFQVDRAIYDDILLRHAESLGTEVREQTRVTAVKVDGDRITGLELDSGETITATHYVDGSGAIGLLRRALGVEVDAPKELRNIAIWDYWENADWAVEIGVGGTRVQVRSLPYGWMWFIPLGPTRTSIGLICPVDAYKEFGLTPEELYQKAINDEPDIRRLVEGGAPRGTVESCKDWSHLAHQVAGPNWFLAGEAAGFADPILAAGMALAHSSARDVAYTILELERESHDAAWLRGRYDERTRTNIAQHIRFAQYWYSTNGCFTDLQDQCAAIAKEAGLRLTPQQAWRWLSQGGFTSQNLDAPSAGSFDLGAAKQIVDWLDGEKECERLWEGYNVFKLKLNGATEDWFGRLAEGKIERVKCLVRGESRLPMHGFFGQMTAILREYSDAATILRAIHNAVKAIPPANRAYVIDRFFQTLDAMIQEGWVERKKKKGKPFIQYQRPNQLIRTAEAGEQAMMQSDVAYRSSITGNETPKYALVGSESE